MARGDHSNSQLQRVRDQALRQMDVTLSLALDACDADNPAERARMHRLFDQAEATFNAALDETFANHCDRDEWEGEAGL